MWQIERKKNRGADHKGEKHGRHKLTEAQVVEIREKYIPRKYSTRRLAKEYGVSQPVVHDIVKYISWKHIVSSV